MYGVSMFGKTVTLRYINRFFLARYIVYSDSVVIFLPDNSLRFVRFLPLQAGRVAQLELLKFAVICCR